MDTVNHGTVVKSVSIENMLNQRNGVMQRIAAALELLVEARGIAHAAHIGFPRLKFETLKYGSCILDHDRLEQTTANILREVDVEAWQYLMNESGLRTFMDAEARRKWDENLQKGDCPELTLENIESTFTVLYAARGDMFERGVIRVFRSLSWDYKTNQPFKFGRRIVLRGLRSSVTGGRSNAFGYLNHRATDELDDLVRVFSVLDGKPQPDHRDGMHRRINDADRENRTGMEAPYFDLRWFKNGNAHLTFNRPELVDKMNKILAKHYPGALAHDHHAEAA